VVDGAVTPGGFRVLVPTATGALRPRAAPPTFSVAIAAYQAASTIGAAIRSAVEQTYPAHEILVVDDGSTDDLDGALKRHSGHIELIRKPNGGPGSARNAAVAAASGEFLAILDADDRYRPRRLEALADLVSLRPDLDIVTTDAAFVVEGEVVGRFAAKNPFATADQRTAILKSCFVGGWPAVRVERLRKIDGFDETLEAAVDWDCWLRLILDGAQAGMIDEPYYEYALHPESVSAGRLVSIQARVRMLDRARGSESLTSHEKAVLLDSLRVNRARLIRLEAQGALVDRRRRRLLGLALAPNVPLRARGLAALGAVVPPLARWVATPDQPPHLRFAAPTR
jgi:hypothetical protein